MLPNTRTSHYVLVDFLPHAPLLMQALVDGTTAAATADASSREAAAANADRDRLYNFMKLVPCGSTYCEAGPRHQSRLRLDPVLPRVGCMQMHLAPL